MDSTLGSFFSPRRQTSGTRSRKITLSQKSLPSLKRPQLLNSVKGLVHRKTQSVGNMRAKRPTAKFAHVNFGPRSQRSQSLDLPQEPPGFQKKGFTPGMDDYLTLAQLENVWQTQGFMHGTPDVPQTASEYTYTYVEPVELGTFVKHQPTEDDTLNAPVKQSNGQLRIIGVLPRSQESACLAKKGHDSGICPPFAVDTSVDMPSIRTTSARPGSESKVISQEPQAVLNSGVPIETSLRSPSKQRTKSPASKSLNDTRDTQTMLDPLVIPNAYRPSTAPSRDSPSLPLVSPESPQRRPDRGRHASRHEVVSGIVHPALRPTPYFNPRHQSTPGCRAITSRFAVDVPRDTNLIRTEG